VMGASFIHGNQPPARAQSTERNCCESKRKAILYILRGFAVRAKESHFVRGAHHPSPEKILRPCGSLSHSQQILLVYALFMLRENLQNDLNKIFVIYLRPTSKTADRYSAEKN